MAALGSRGVGDVLDSHGKLSLGAAIEKLIIIINQFAPRVGLAVLSEAEQNFMKAQAKILIPFRMQWLVPCLDITLGNWRPGQENIVILSDLTISDRWGRVKKASATLEAKIALHEKILSQFSPDEGLSLAIISYDVQLKIYPKSYDYLTPLRKHDLKGVSLFTDDKSRAFFTLSVDKDNTDKIKAFLVESGFAARGGYSTLSAWWSGGVSADAPAAGAGAGGGSS